MAEVELGKVTHYFSKIGVAAIQLTQDTLRVGRRSTSKATRATSSRKIDSMQIDGQVSQRGYDRPNPSASRERPRREHDQVFKVVE